MKCYALLSMILPSTVALALREQLLGPGEVPVGDTDWNMDIIVTPDEIVGTET